MSARAWNRRRARKRYRRLAEAADAFPWQSWVIFDEAWQMSEADLKDRLSAGQQQRWPAAVEPLTVEGIVEMMDGLLEHYRPRYVLGLQDSVEPLTVEGVKEAMESLRRQPALTIEFDLDDVAPEALALLCGDSSATIGDNEGETPPP